MINNFSKYQTGNDKGFTLIEILIAITILSIGLLAVASMQISAIRGNSFANDLTEGTTLASEKLESIIRIAERDYNDTLLRDVDDDGNSGLDHSGADADFHNAGPKYTVSYNISTDSPFIDTKIVKVIVTWTRGSSPKKVAIQHILPLNS